MAFLSCIDSVPMGFVALPAPHILLSSLVLPQAVTLHRPIFKVPNVVLILELHHSLPVGLVVCEISHVY